VIQVFDLAVEQNRSDQNELVGSSGPKRISVTHDISDLASVWPRSNQLGTARCYAFQCADILELYCETVLPARNATPVFVAILNKNDEPLALIPLSIEHRYKTRILRFIDGGLSEINVPVVFSTSRDWSVETTQLIWQSLHNILQFDVAFLEKMPDCIGDIRNPLSVLKTSKESFSCHAMTLSEPWEKKFSELSPTRRIKRQERRLSRRGRVEFEIAEKPGQYDVILNALARQKTQRYLETRGIDGLTRPGYHPFLKSVGRLLYPSGAACLFALKIDDLIVATVLGFIVGSRFYYWMPSIERGEWRSYSPGHILIYKIAEWCCAHGVDVFDFGLGDEEYKLNYCDVSTALYRAEISSTRRGQIYLLLRRGWTKGLRMKEFLSQKMEKHRSCESASGDAGMHIEAIGFSPHPNVNAKLN
jgi:CelD/BcsL family acetyltransferase involved in cellulose biosynthesis